MAETKPTVLFVHGAWHTPKHFAPVRSIFEKAGYPTLCPPLPSVGGFLPVGLKEDAQCIAEELSRLIIEQEKEVVVIPHSYGGVVTTQAADAKFAKAARMADGKRGGVRSIMYMCAFVPPLGKTLAEVFGGIPDFIPVDEDGRCTMLNPEQVFYQDLPIPEQSRWASELLKMPASSTQHVQVTGAAYLHHPVIYFFCKNDQALPYELQKSMVEEAKLLGVEWRLEECDASHSPFLSIPETVLKAMEGNI